MFVRPKAGHKVRDPKMMPPQHIPATGKEVPDTGPAASYWMRCIADGSVEVVDAPKAAAKGKA